MPLELNWDWLWVAAGAALTLLLAAALTGWIIAEWRTAPHHPPAPPPGSRP